MRRLGLITIGQSPRVDAVPELKEILGDVEIVECGALDGLSREQVAELAPREGEHLFVTRLRDGTEVKVARERILPLLQRCIDELESRVDVMAIFCTGELPGLRSSKPLVELSELLLRVVEALKVRRLGVVIPDPRQVRMTEERWLRVAPDVKVLSLSPYTGTLEELDRVSRELGDRDLVVLDCVGFSKEAKRVAATASGRPVILPRTLLARVLRELLEV